jgi:murein DD-endopeptidase MepM/ murein hydrolase activator NlpD
MRPAVSALLILLLAGVHPLAGEEIAWPTPQAGYLRGEGIERFLQPTRSGRLESALFGLVRNGGTRFHEGLDLRSFQRDRQGESTDAVYAVAAGEVTYVNAIAGNSSYGRYVVVEHDRFDVPVYSLYGHLRDIAGNIEPGVRVRAGSQLGRMGRTAAGYSIPRSRAHLHFEFGLRVSDHFQDWYDAQGYGSENTHGIWNGMNLIGADPLPFFATARAGKLNSMRDYLWSLPTAYTLKVATHRVPDFISRYPRLLSRPVPVEGVAGWQIDFTWYGLPKRWTPLTEPPRPNAEAGQIFLARANWRLLEGKAPRGTLVRDKDGAARIGSFTRRTMAQLFGFR